MKSLLVSKIMSRLFSEFELKLKSVIRRPKHKTVMVSELSIKTLSLYFSQIKLFVIERFKDVLHITINVILDTMRIS